MVLSIDHAHRQPLIRFRWMRLCGAIALIDRSRSYGLPLAQLPCIGQRNENIYVCRQYIADRRRPYSPVSFSPTANGIGSLNYNTRRRLEHDRIVYRCWWVPLSRWHSMLSRCRLCERVSWYTGYNGAPIVLIEPIKCGNEFPEQLLCPSVRVCVSSEESTQTAHKMVRECRKEWLCGLSGQ